MQDDIITSQAATKLLEDCVFSNVRSNKSLTERDAINLHNIYGKTLQTALSLLDKKLVEKVESENGRPLFLVAGSQAHPYVCFTDYCPCYYFTQKVIVSSEALACKHTLAVRIADALGSLHASKVTKEQFSEYLVLQGSSPATYKSPSKGFYSSR